MTEVLRTLETDGLVEREVFPTVPPAVEYRLTPLGTSLLGPISALADWAVTHRADLSAARAHRADPAPTEAEAAAVSPPL